MFGLHLVSEELIHPRCDLAVVLDNDLKGRADVLDGLHSQPSLGFDREHVDADDVVWRHTHPSEERNGQGIVDDELPHLTAVALIEVAPVSIPDLPLSLLHTLVQTRVLNVLTGPDSLFDVPFKTFPPSPRPAGHLLYPGGVVVGDCDVRVIGGEAGDPWGISSPRLLSLLNLLEHRLHTVTQLHTGPTGRLDEVLSLTVDQEVEGFPRLNLLGIHLELLDSEVHEVFPGVLGDLGAWFQGDTHGELRSLPRDSHPPL